MKLITKFEGKKLQIELITLKEYFKKNKDYCFKPHYNDFSQLVWFKKKGEHFINFEKQSFQENSFFLSYRNQTQSFLSDKNEGYVLSFSDDFLNHYEKDALNQIQFQIFNLRGSPFIKITQSESDKFESLFKQFSDEIKNQDFNYELQVYNLFQIMLLNVERMKRRDPDFNSFIDQNFMLALSFKKAIEKYKCEFKTLAFYADMLSVSEKTIITVTKNYFRDTPTGLMRKKRLLEAKRLLINTNLPIKEVSFRLGFQQTTYFTKFFKKETSMTPKVFREKIGLEF
ncbi:helix-turn-helix domain-containing protein [Flavobacteriaceae bacterium S356]|uniref:Helix-turn-helix domain-containing protein n=1 Tax=Asprobacillus argus TaxID=3076534 RepID=A0ABU3LB15_9FLAO|nr:helix-turn-helix domain-containing protein [Flavobacteriaceae bacterium S356]